MAKTKKKKKDLDFQKVKLKIGRKLKRDSNETKAEFKSRKIILKEVKSYDPLVALNRQNVSQHAKLTLLNRFNSAITGDVILNKPILDSLSKFIVDRSDQVRTAAIKCLKKCYNHTKQQHLSTREFMMSLKPYLSCAYTHVSAGIVADAQKLLEHFVSVNDPEILEPLMMVILKRCEAGGLSETDKKLALKLKRYYSRHKQKETIKSLLDEEPLVWTEDNFFLDLDQHIHNNDNCDNEIRLGLKDIKRNIVNDYLNIVVDEGGQDNTE